MHTGTCASGGPYVSARPCPPGTGLHVLALVGGVFGGLIGIAIYAARGGQGKPSPVGLGAIMWAFLFCSIAGVSLIAAFGPASNGDDGIKVMAAVFGLVFIPMGIAPIAFSILGRGKVAEKIALVEHGKRCAGVVVSVEDTGITINDNPRVKLTVRAEPPGEPPFTIVKTPTVSRVNIPRAGDRCTVFYDAADRENKNGITFDPVPGFTPTPATAASAPAPAEAAAPAGESLYDKLTKLGELRASGVLTEEEFETQKKKLLGG
jgi:hypothetical protein